MRSYLSLLGLPNKIPQAGGLKHKFIFSQSWRLEVQDWGAGRVRFWQGPFFGLADGCLLAVCFHGGGREKQHFWCSQQSNNAVSPGPTLNTSSNTNHLPRVPSANTNILRGRAPTYEFWGDTDSQSITGKFLLFNLSLTGKIVGTPLYPVIYCQDNAMLNSPQT